MAEVLVGSERRVLLSGYGLPAPPPPESLLGRLDQIDLRLRQLEEQRRAQGEQSYFAADLRLMPAQHHHINSLPAALQQVQLKGTLMDRLNLLESRIRQLSCELDSKDGSSSVERPVEDPAWSELAIAEPLKEVAICAPTDKPAAGSWSAVQIIQRGTRQLHHQNKSNSNKAKNLKEANCACQNEKKKAERNRSRRRWFPVGC